MIRGYGNLLKNKMGKNKYFFINNMYLGANLFREGRQERAEKNHNWDGLSEEWLNKLDRGHSTDQDTGITNIR
jgi:hypothetical protein